MWLNGVVKRFSGRLIWIALFGFWLATSTGCGERDGQHVRVVDVGAVGFDEVRNRVVVAGLPGGDHGFQRGFIERGVRVGVGPRGR